MILLFGEKAHKSLSSKKNTHVNTHPVENSGILAMSFNEAKSLLTAGEFDTYISNNPFAVNYAMYANSGEFSLSNCGFLSQFSNAVSYISSTGGFSDCGAASTGTSAGFSGGSFSSGGSFASVC